MQINKISNSLWTWQVIGWLIYFLLMFLSFLTRDTHETLAYIFLVKAFRTLVGFSLSCLLWLIYRQFVANLSLGKTMFTIVVSSAFLGVVWTVLETMMFWLTLPEFDFWHSLQFKPRVALSYTVTLVAWSAIYFGVTYFKQVQIEHQNTLRAKCLAESAQLEMLRYQVNPHFLFNALNSIRASIHPDNPNAKEMITQLAEFLRHSLMSKDQIQTSLAKEIEAAKNYLSIEKIRFEEALDIEYRIDEKTKDLMIPSFLLNPLIENAITHGFKTTTGTLKIAICAWIDQGRLIIEVQNSGELNHHSDGHSSHIGLKNVQERLDKQLANHSVFSLFERNGTVVARIEITL